MRVWERGAGLSSSYYFPRIIVHVKKLLLSMKLILFFDIGATLACGTGACAVVLPQFWRVMLLG